MDFYGLLRDQIHAARRNASEAERRGNFSLREYWSWREQDLRRYLRDVCA